MGENTEMARDSAAPLDIDSTPPICLPQSLLPLVPGAKPPPLPLWGWGVEEGFGGALHLYFISSGHIHTA